MKIAILTIMLFLFLGNVAYSEEPSCKRTTPSLSHEYKGWIISVTQADSSIALKFNLVRNLNVLLPEKVRNEIEAQATDLNGLKAKLSTLPPGEEVGWWAPFPLPHDVIAEIKKCANELGLSLGFK